MSYNPTVIGLSQTIQTLTEVVRSMAANKPLDSTERTIMSDFAARLDSLGNLESVTVDDIVSIVIGMPQYVVDTITQVALQHRQIELMDALSTKVDTAQVTLADIANDVDATRIAVVGILAELYKFTPGTLGYQVRKIAENIDKVTIAVSALIPAASTAINLSATPIKTFVPTCPTGTRLRIHGHLHEVFNDNLVSVGSYYEVNLHANAIVLAKIYGGYCAAGNKFTEHDIIFEFDVAKATFDAFGSVDTLKISYTDAVNGTKDHAITGSIGFNLVLEDLVEDS